MTNDKSYLKGILKWRKTLLKNIKDEKLIDVIKKSKKKDLLNQGQLSLFNEFEKSEIKINLKEYSGPLNLIQITEWETEAMGVPVTYDPLDEKWMYKELYCTHNVMDLLSFTEYKDKVIIMDRIIKIDKRISKNNNPYAKIHLSLLGEENYMYLSGKNYVKLISQVFLNEIYLFEIQYRTATPQFNKDSISITYLKNIKDVDIESEYERLISDSVCKTLHKSEFIGNRLIKIIKNETI